MGRAPRPQSGFFHVTTRGIRRQPIFADDRDRECFLDVLGDSVSRFRWKCHIYCLMGNHYHLVVETCAANLSSGMCRINGTYARTFNRRHGFEGHLFEARFHSVPIDADAHMLELARYVVLNPVRAGLCDHPARWVWSSYAATAGLVPAAAFLSVGWLLGLFGSTVARAHRSYQAFVEGGRPGALVRPPLAA